MIELEIKPIGRGMYRAWLGDRVLVRSTREPLLAGARVLLAEGVPAATRIGMRRAGSAEIALSSTVGGAARLTVIEREGGNGPVFERWKALRYYAEA